MAGPERFAELARQFSAFGAVKRELGRALPHDCPPGSTAVLTLLGRHGEMRMSRLAELLAVDMSVTSRQVAHLAERGWIDRSPDPADKRSRILRLTPAGEAKLQQIFESTTRMLSDRLGDWSENDIDELIRLLTRLRARFGDCRSPHPPHTSEPTPVHPHK
ncbi:MarR family winged helix-turn-helix transcriptional regulator [Streptomyces cavernae]|uniref:MarR family winged helix-turn-helix transcriptional regulator n=1 Tax=Streptomyces cavernae TaxID=2259034 RepID=UPI000FEB7D28|nr:MarR family transcriptional regulator [Streptomyces cavernae]